MLVLGLETSCDETAVGIVDAERRIRAHQLVTQLAEHKPYGGVVPEIAARAHLDHLDGLIHAALAAPPSLGTFQAPHTSSAEITACQAATPH